MLSIHSMSTKKIIPYARQDISAEDIQAVVDVLKSDFLTHGGPIVPLFENAVSKYCGANYGVATNSATSALHIACLALGVGHGDIVWTSPISFVASANCAIYCGAKVDFVDIDPDTKNMSPFALEEKLKIADTLGQLPKVIIPVHFCGQPCEMEKIFKLSIKYGFKIIEDASHAIGARYQHNNIGSCKYSQITIFSFHPVKIITSGEGGMAVCNDPNLYEAMMIYRSHGITSNPEKMSQRPATEIWNYQQINLGFNYRLSEIHAALGLSQLTRINKFVSRRHEIACAYDKGLRDLPVTQQAQHPDSYSSYHLYPICLDLSRANVDQRYACAKFDSAGISVNIHYIPIYLQPYYEKIGFRAGYCIEAEKYYRETISLPMYASLSDEDLNYVISTAQKLLG